MFRFIEHITRERCLLTTLPSFRSCSKPTLVGDDTKRAKPQTETISDVVLRQSNFLAN